MLVSGAGPAAVIAAKWKRVAKFCAAIALLSILGTCIFIALNAHSPGQPLVLTAQGLSAVSLASALVALVSGSRHFLLARPALLRTALILVIITVSVFAAHLYIINAPSPPQGQNCAADKQGCVGDESYYVPEALRILRGEPCSTDSGLTPDCHLEHPFLAKAMMAAGMAVFGVNDFGWRIFIVIFGTLSIPILFILVLMVSGNRKLAFFSSLFLAADTLFFVQSSIAMLEIPSIFFSLLAFVFYFWRGSFWKVDNLVASGICLGLAILCKETAVFMAVVLLTYHFYTNRTSLSRTTIGIMKMLLPALAVFLVGLQIYASLFTVSTTPTFYQEIQYVFHYGSGLVGCDKGWIDPVLQRCPTPIDWLAYYTASTWFSSSVTVTMSNGGVQQYVGVAFYKLTNPLVIWLVFAWVPMVVVKKLRRKPEGSVESADDRLGVFALFWFFWGWFPYVILWFPINRTVYPFYILPAVPALAIGTAYFLTRDWFPSKLALLYLIAAFGWFFLYFPDKDFLPVWIRVILAR